MNTKKKYPHCEDYPAYFKSYFQCHYCGKRIQRSNSIGRLECRRHTDGKTIRNGESVYRCCGEDGEGCQQCDHTDCQLPEDGYTFVPLFVIEGQMITPKKSNIIQRVLNDEEGDSDKPVNPYTSYYTIRRVQ